MSEDRDERIVEFLRASAPPPRDPVFRLKTLERREQRRLRQRCLTMLVGALVILMVSILGISIGGGALKAAGAVVFSTALVTGYLAFRGRLLRILRRFSI